MRVDELAPNPPAVESQNPTSREVVDLRACSKMANKDPGRRAWVSSFLGAPRTQEIASLPKVPARGGSQPLLSERRTASTGQFALASMTRTRDPSERLISACEQIASSMPTTSISVVDCHCNVFGVSPGQMRQADPSLSSTMWLRSCCLIRIWFLVPSLSSLSLGSFEKSNRASESTTSGQSGSGDSGEDDIWIRSAE